MKKLAAAAFLTGAAVAPGVAQASPPNHWCRQGDPPILASSRTSCDMAGAMVNRYAQSGAPHNLRAWVRSPVTHRRDLITYHADHLGRWKVRVSATGPDGLSARFDWDLG